MKVAVTVLIFCVAALLKRGMVMLYSSSMAQVGARFLVMQSIWCVLGIISAVTMTLVDYRRFKQIWWLLLGTALCLLVMVLAFGVVRGHARRWFSLGPVSFQPSEFAKVALLIALAWYAERYRRQMSTWKIGIAIPGIVIGVMAGLIFKEPDVGNALLLFCFFARVSLSSFFSPRCIGGSFGRRALYLPQPDAL